MIGKERLIKDFENHCEQIAQATTVNVFESEQEQEERIRRAKRDYRFFATYYFPHYCQDKDTGRKIDASPFQVKAAYKILKNKVIDIVLQWYRSAAKSTHALIFIPIWLWINLELRFMLVVGENRDKAEVLLSDIQAEFMTNERLKRDFGKQFNLGHWEEGHFILKDGTAFYSLGAGQSPRGIRNRQDRPDYIVVDDIDTKKRCKNPRLVREVGEWCIEDLRGCFGTWRQRYVHVNNLIHDNSVLNYVKKKLVKAYVIAVCAVNNLTDFKPTWPQRDTEDFWREKFASTPYRSFMREYMNQPIEEGTVFKQQWIHWGKLPSLKTFDKIVVYADPSFKSGSKNDYKAVKAWGLKGTKLYLIDAFVRQTSVVEMVNWFYDFEESLPDGAIADYYMEATFMQDMLLDVFDFVGEERGYQLPIIGDKRSKPDKFQRIEATSPLYERGHVIYNEEIKDSSDMKNALDQLLAFEKGSNSADDSPDADEGAIWLLQRYGRSSRQFKQGDMIIGYDQKNRY